MNSNFWTNPMAYSSPGQLPVFVPPPQLSLPNINPMNWSLVDAIDPEVLSSNKDRKTMNRFTAAFLDATTFIADSPGLIEKMIQILQVCVGDLQVQNIKYKSMVNQLEEENSNLRKQIHFLKKDNTQICPICNKFTSSMSNLDSHVFKRHQNLAPIWKIIRTPFESKPEQFNALANTLKIYQAPKSKHEEGLKRHVRELTQQLASMRGEFEGLKATIGSQLMPTKRHKSQKKRRHSHKEVYSFSLPANEESRQAKSSFGKAPPKAQTPPSQNKSMIEKRVRIRHSPSDKERKKLVRNLESISDSSDYDQIIEISDIPKPQILPRDNKSNKNASAKKNIKTSNENLKANSKPNSRIFKDDFLDESSESQQKSQTNAKDLPAEQKQVINSKSKTVDEEISLEFSSEIQNQEQSSSEPPQDEKKPHTMWSASSTINSTSSQQPDETDQKVKKAEQLRNSIDDLLKERQLARQRALNDQQARNSNNAPNSFGIAEMLQKKPSTDGFELTEPEIEEPHVYENASEALDFEEFHNTPRRVLRHTDSLENGEFFEGDPGPIYEEEFEEDYEYNERHMSGDRIPPQNYDNNVSQPLFYDRQTYEAYDNHSDNSYPNYDDYKNHDDYNDRQNFNDYNDRPNYNEYNDRPNYNEYNDRPNYNDQNYEVSDGKYGPPPPYGHRVLIDDGPPSPQQQPRIISRRDSTQRNRLVTTRMESPPVEEVVEAEEEDEYEYEYVNDYGSSQRSPPRQHPNGTLSSVSWSSSARSSDSVPVRASVAQTGVDWGVAYGGPDGRAVVRMTSSEASPSRPVQDNWKATRRSTDNLY